MPIKSLPSRPSLDQLKNQAKDLLKSFHSADPDAFARVGEFHPKFPKTPNQENAKAKFTLSDAQVAIAREYGFQSWPKLRQHVLATPSAPDEPSSTAPSNLTHAERVAMFLENACPDHHVRGGADHLMAQESALSLLRKHPEIARDSIYTAVVCGEIDEVRRILAVRPETAREKNPVDAGDRPGSGGSYDRFRKKVGGQNWEPLIFLCFTRLPIESVTKNAVAIAQLLLDHGANPNAFFMAGGSRYTPLVGVIGEGEEGRPPHQRRDALAGLLLERAAEPYDIQVIYNIRFLGKVLWFLKLIYAQSLKLGRASDWADPEWSMLGMGGYGSGARWHLDIAVTNNDLELARWALAHGASPNAEPSRAKHLSKRSLYEDALSAGFTEMANLLLQHGALPTDLKESDVPAFHAACLRRDRVLVGRLLQLHPEYVKDSKILIHAATQDLLEVVAFLLDAGFSANLEDPKNGNQRPLHAAASARVTQMLLEAGAQVDFRESNFDATALGFAIWGQNFPKIEVLSRFSKDIWGLTIAGQLERLRTILATEPELARVGGEFQTPLMWLPANESRAIEIAKLFLSLGVDPSIRNKDGLTAADLAARRGMDTLAKIIGTTSPRHQAA